MVPSSKRTMYKLIEEEEEEAEEDMDSAYADPNADAPQKELTPRGETEVEAEGVNVEIQGETKL